MIRCIYCGKSFEDDAVFCSACGKRLIVEKQPVSDSKISSPATTDEVTLEAMIEEESRTHSMELQYQIGDIYFSGKSGVPQDYEKAVYWFKEAAYHNHVVAQYALATCYENGRGVKIDDNMAFNWYKRASENGNTAAKLIVGKWYEDGKGVARDLFQSASMYLSAFFDGEPRAADFLRAFFEKYLIPSLDADDVFRTHHVCKEKTSTKFAGLGKLTFTVYATDDFSLFAEKILRFKCIPERSDVSDSDEFEIKSVFTNLADSDKSDIYILRKFHDYFFGNDTGQITHLKSRFYNLGDDPAFCAIVNYCVNGTNYTVYEWWSYDSLTPKSQNLFNNLLDAVDVNDVRNVCNYAKFSDYSRKRHDILWIVGSLVVIFVCLIPWLLYFCN